MQNCIFVHIVYSIQINSVSSRSDMAPEESISLRPSLAASALGGGIVCKDLDDAVGICMTVPLGGDVHV